MPAAACVPETATGPALVLASASPRRRELIARLGITPAGIIATDIDETPLPAEIPRVYVTRMAREKARAAVADAHVLAGEIDMIESLTHDLLPLVEKLLVEAKPA